MIDFFTAATANGQKAAIMLEESGLPYTAHIVDLRAGGHQTPEFLAMNPGGRIPAIRDTEGPGGATLNLSQSLAIVSYLARKSGRLLPETERERIEADRWMAIIASDVSMAFAGLFRFKVLAPQPQDFAVADFAAAAHRQLKLLDEHLAESPYLAGERYTVADVLGFPVSVSSVQFLGGLDGYPGIERWRDAIAARPAVQRAMALC
jgi:GSH-dependent disulfide-bond oxidoreductase